jgi:hypothetical protein
MRESSLFSFALVMACSSALNNVFATYYVGSFMGGDAGCGVRSWAGAALTGASFFAAQLLFAVWNAANDPLLGWLSDDGSGARACCSRRFAAAWGAWAPSRRRAWVMRWGGVAWCAFFAGAWFPPRAGSSGALLLAAHFALSLCLYDGALTAVEVNHSALLAEMRAPGGGAAGEGGPSSATLRLRASANAWAGFAAALGSVTSFPAHEAWAADCGGGGGGGGGTPLLSAAWRAAGLPWPGHFRAFAVVLACLCAAGFFVAAAGIEGGGGALAAAAAPPPPPRAAGGAAAAADEEADAGTPWLRRRDSKPHALYAEAACGAFLGPYRDFLGALWALPEARAYIALSSVQAFDCAFGKSFFASYLLALCAAAGAQPGWRAQAALVCASFLVPHLLTLALAPAVASRGVVAVLGGLARFRSALAVAAAAATVVLWWAGTRGGGGGGGGSGGAIPPAALLAAAACYQLASRVSSEAVCRAMPVLRAAMVDVAERGGVGGAREGPNRLHCKPAALIGAAEFLPRVAASLAPAVGFAVVGHASGGAAVWAALLAVPAATAGLQVLLINGMGVA